LAEIDRVYWDACAWIALIQEEAVRHTALRKIYESARRGGFEIWTSAFTYAEVYKKKCEIMMQTCETEEDKIDDVLTQEFVKLVNVDRMIGESARKLLRANPGIKKPQDGIHVATALWYNLDALHTFDGSDLLKFHNKLNRKDGEKLIICVPNDETFGPLFSRHLNEEAT
jgi:predicted nucleic acid-binding protein